MPPSIFICSSSTSMAARKLASALMWRCGLDLAEFARLSASSTSGGLYALSTSAWRVAAGGLVVPFASAISPISCRLFSCAGC